MKNEFLETIRIKDGKIFNLSYHQKRYESVLKHFHIDKIKKLQDYINPPKTGLYRCRVVYDFNDIHVTFYPYTKREVNSLKLVYDDTIDYPFKYTNRQKIDELFKQKAKCDDILIVKNSLITDTSIANIAFYKNSNWFTPKTPLLKGTTRQRLIDDGKLIPKDITVDEIHTFSKIALLNAMIDFYIVNAKIV